MTVALISLARDDPQRALAMAERAVEEARAQLAVLPKFPAFAVNAYVRASLGDLEGAREMTRELIAFRDGRGGHAFGADAHAVWAWQEVGLLADVLAALPTERRTPWLEAAHAVLEGSWRDAAEIYDRCGSPVSAALARLRSGEDGNVRAALEYFHSLRAPFYERQAEAALAATA
jgi:hypothetical protein